MKAKITYYLNEEGRRASLLSGGDGKMIQMIEGEVPADLANLFPVGIDGDVVAYVWNKGLDLHEHPKWPSNAWRSIEHRHLAAVSGVAMSHHVNGSWREVIIDEHQGFARPHSFDEVIMLLRIESSERKIVVEEAFIQNEKREIESKVERLLGESKSAQARLSEAESKLKSTVQECAAKARRVDALERQVKFLLRAIRSKASASTP